MSGDSFRTDGADVESLADAFGGANLLENDEAERLIIGLVCLHSRV